MNSQAIPAEIREQAERLLTQPVDLHQAGALARLQLTVSTMPGATTERAELLEQLSQRWEMYRQAAVDKFFTQVLGGEDRQLVDVLAYQYYLHVWGKKSSDADLGAKYFWKQYQAAFSLRDEDALRVEQALLQVYTDKCETRPPLDVYEAFWLYILENAWRAQWAMKLLVEEGVLNSKLPWDNDPERLHSALQILAKVVRKQWRSR